MTEGNNSGNGISREDDLKFRDSSGRFTRGRPSVGPIGTKGKPHWRTKLARKIAEAVTEDEYKAIFRRLAVYAAKGDMQAARLLFERGVGKPTSTPEVMDSGLDLPPLTSSKAIVMATNMVVSAMASGGIDPDSAARLLDAIEIARKAVDTDEIQERLARLERDRDEVQRLN